MKGIRALIPMAALLFAVTLVDAAEETPDATLKLSGGSIAVGLGVSWGSGTLSYQGKDYPISVTGVSVGALGATKLEAEGRVYNLERLEDFDGNYAAAGAEATVAEGASVVTMQNAKGVKVHLGATTAGIKVTLGAGGVDMKIKQ